MQKIQTLNFAGLDVQDSVRVNVILHVWDIVQAVALGVLDSARYNVLDAQGHVLGLVCLVLAHVWVHVQVLVQIRVQRQVKVVINSQRVMSSDIIKKNDGGWKNGMAKNITFIVTKDCQLACKYCYLVGKNEKERMSWDIAKKAIDYIL